jgi:hypothetical protein
MKGKAAVFLVFLGLLFQLATGFGCSHLASLCRLIAGFLLVESVLNQIWILIGLKKLLGMVSYFLLVLTGMGLGLGVEC